MANKNITCTKLLLPYQLGELAHCILFSFLIFSTVDIDVLGYIFDVWPLERFSEILVAHDLGDIIIWMKIC